MYKYTYLHLYVTHIYICIYIYITNGMPDRPLLFSWRTILDVKEISNGIPHFMGICTGMKLYEIVFFVPKNWYRPKKKSLVVIIDDYGFFVDEMIIGDGWNLWNCIFWRNVRSPVYLLFTRVAGVWSIYTKLGIQSKCSKHPKESTNRLNSTRNKNKEIKKKARILLGYNIGIRWDN